jgi:GNAT superfamily N-acetyltransferase
MWMTMEIKKIPLGRLDGFNKFLPDEVIDIVLKDNGSILFGAFYEEKPAGLTAAICKNNEVKIVSIYVQQDLRKNGIGSALIYALAEGCPVLNGEISSFNSLADSGHMDFFTSLGFREKPPENNRGTFFLTLNDLSEVLSKLECRQERIKIVPLNKVSPIVFKRFLRRAGYYKGNPYCIQSVNTRISQVLVSGKEAVGACIFSTSEKKQEISWLYTEPGFNEEIPALLDQVHRYALYDLPGGTPETQITLQALNEKTYLMVEKTLPGYTFVPFTEVSAEIRKLLISAKVKELTKMR